MRSPPPLPATARRRPVRRVLAAGWLAMLAAGPAAAAEPAGIVKRVAGSVTLQRGGETLAVAPGLAVEVGDRLVTGADGAVGVTLADDSRLTAGPASTLVISAFRFEPTTQDGSWLATLARGTLHVVTGLVARSQPQNVQVRTPTAVMGVRGTEFIVDARDTGGAR